MRLNLIVGLVASVFVAGCNYQVKKNVGGDQTAPQGKPEQLIAYDDVETRVLGPSCSKCHDDFGTYKELMDSGNVSAGHSDASPLFLRLKNNGGDMPRGRGTLPDTDVALLKSWIDSGAPEFASNDPRSQAPVAKPAEPAPAPAPAEPVPVQPAPAPQPQPQPTPVNATFSAISSQILQAKCVMCHSDAQQTAGFSLQHYDQIVANTRLIDKANPDQSGLLESIEDDYMPPKRAVKAGAVQGLTADEKSAIKAWIESGSPNN